MKYHYLWCYFTHWIKNKRYKIVKFCIDSGIEIWLAWDINFGNIQAGSLAGAAHLLKDNAGVQWLAHLG